MLKFITDVDIGISVYEVLKKAEYDVISAILINPSMPDSEIISIANDEKRIVITMDKDFGELVFQNRLTHDGVLLIRQDNLSSHEKAELVLKIVKMHGEQLPSKFSVYKNGNLRIRE